MFTKAIVRKPCARFAGGLTTASLGQVDLQRALEQHEAYRHALESCGLDVIELPADEKHPDSTFVEDTAILTARGAIITRPGAESRRGEIDAIEPVLRRYFNELHSIREPGTVDGGDVCQTGEHFLIGVSKRTNEEGANQLARWLDSVGYTSGLIDIRGLSNILHLKSGLAYIGGERLLITETLPPHQEFRRYELTYLSSVEQYAANCVAVNGKVLVAAGFDAMKNQLEDLDYQTIALEMSEFQKMDGGLSCLSLRF
ncbi:MAG TPA: arginine deiminase family protein [Pyrinomonadaceae bacterium]|nr:arginine deiminase family protein [Pyrinomonadaceae bacterium]